MRSAWLPVLAARDSLLRRRRDLALLVGVCLAIAACSSSAPTAPDRDKDSDSGGDAGASGDAGSAKSGSPGASSASGASGHDGVPSAAGEAGAAGEPSSTGDAGAGGATVDAPPLPDGTLLYVRHDAKDRDVLVARDLASDDERVITDLTGDGSSGWEIDSFALSPDRQRIALSSLYGPTKADNATGLATRAIWTLSTSGADFRRLTPTFPKDTQGRQGFQYDVGSPEWTADGSHVMYGFGEYWWEGTTFQGGSFPWIVSAAGNELPSSFPTSTDCSVLYPSRNPATGQLLFIHSVCVPGQGDGAGIYLYPAKGGKNPQPLVLSSQAAGNVDVFLAKPHWFSDGSGFLFMGGTVDTDGRPSLLVYDATASEISMLVPAPVGTGIWSVAVSPDSSKIVYCLHDDEGGEDLHLIDLSLDTPTDTALTSDGKSCSPSF